jgi:hypothetical protein
MTLADIGWANRNAWAPQMVQRDGKQATQIGQAAQLVRSNIAADRS